MEALGIRYEFLWGTALAVVPLAIAAAMVGAMLKDRPAARHALWISVLVSLVTPVLLSVVGVPRLVDVDGLWGEMSAGVTPAPSGLGGGLAAGTIDAAIEDARTHRTPAHIIDRPGDSRDSGRGTSRMASSGAESLSDLAGLPALGGEFAPAANGSDEFRARTMETVPPADRDVSLTNGAGEESPRSWRHAAGAGVEAIRAIPPMPRWLWAGGAALFGLLLVRQLARLMLIVRRAEVAPAETQALVRELSGRLGLRRAPTAMVVDRSISPMISCGLRPRVILPARLWSDLDQASREAVLVHELAHLRRRDHVVCWAETLLGVVYWWHPVVWWVRRRLHEDADLCCDAWVVSLFPRHRRAYAEALVTTREFMGGGSARAVALGLGMASPRARRFSRRLSMVMTRRLSPRASGVGLLLAVSALGAGAMLTPAIACPPEEKGAQKELIQLQHQHQIQHEAGRTDVSHAGQSVSSGGGGEVRAALRAREAAIAALAQRQAGGVTAGHAAQEAAIGTLAQRQAGGTRAGIVSQEAAIAALAQPGSGSVEARIARLEARVDRMLALLEGGSGGAAVQRAVPTPPTAPRQIADWPIVEEAVVEPGETLERAYQLPEGKLDALWALMARQDVPVFVSRGGDGSIVVQGNARQQRIFAAFVAMIHPEGAVAEASAIGAGESAIAQQRMARAYEEAARQANEANARRGRDENQVRRREIEIQRKAMHAERQTLERKIESMLRKAEQLFERSEVVSERAEELEEAADEAEGERADQLRAQAERLSVQAADLEAQGEALEEEAERLEEMLDDYEDRIEQFEDEMEELDDEGDEDDDECEEAEETESEDERI